jgi:hypothetical protein
MDVKEPETWDAAVKMCQANLQKFVPEHERVDLKIHFYVFTPRSGDPIIVKTPGAALKEAIAQDRAEETLEKLEREWARASITH